MHANPYRPNLLELGVLLFWPPPPWDDTKRHFTQFITTHSTADAEGIAVKFIANFWKGSCNSLVLIYTNPVVSRYHLGWKAVNRAFLRIPKWTSTLQCNGLSWQLLLQFSNYSGAFQSQEPPSFLQNYPQKVIQVILLPGSAPLHGGWYPPRISGTTTHVVADLAGPCFTQRP